MPRTEQLIKCISIRQPWAWLVCAGAKDIENRGRAPTYRGIVAVHAGANTQAVRVLRNKDVSGSIDFSQFSLGAIIGTVELVDVVIPPIRRLPESWAVGPYCLVFRNPQLFDDPIPHKGRLSIYTLPDETAMEVHRRIGVTDKRQSNETINAILSIFPPGPIESRFLRPKS